MNDLKSVIKEMLKSVFFVILILSYEIVKNEKIHFFMDKIFEWDKF